MQKKLFNSKYLAAFFLLALLVTATAYAQTSDYALHDDFVADIEFADVGCTEQSSGWIAIEEAEKDPGGNVLNDWLSDSNSTDPDCARLRLTNAGTKSDQDFRFCIQFADNLSEVDGVQSVSQARPATCTAWASEGGSGPLGSGWEADGDGTDFDAVKVYFETKDISAIDKVIADYRIGIQFGDNQCTSDYGVTKFTPWLSDGGGASEFATDADGNNPDCGRIYLDSIVEEVDVVYIPAEDQPYADYDGDLIELEYLHNGGDIRCPGNSVPVMTWHDDTGDRHINFSYCQNFVNLMDNPDDDYKIVEMRIEKATYTCDPDEVVTGFQYLGLPDVQQHGDNGSIGIICEKVKSGSIDRTKEVSIGVAGCPGDHCMNRADGTPTGLGFGHDGLHSGQQSGEAWVIVGANHNHDPQENNRGLVFAPLKTINVPAATPPGLDPGEVPFPENPACSNGFDDDGDGGIDYGSGPNNDDQCLSPFDDSEDMDEREEQPDLCANGEDDDHDGYTDEEDPGCDDGGDEYDNISCGFSATPNVVAIGIGTSALSWNCLHADGSTPIHPSLRVIIDASDTSKEFPALAGDKSGDGTANVSPERLTNFFLRIFGVNYADGDPRAGDPIHVESAEVRVSTTSFDEIIP